MSDSKKDLIIGLINAGHTAAEIMEKVGCSRNYVYTIRSNMSKDQEKAIVAKRAAKKVPAKKAKRAAKATKPSPVTGSPIGLRERTVRGRRIVSVEFDLGAA